MLRKAMTGLAALATATGMSVAASAQAGAATNAVSTQTPYTAAVSMAATPDGGGYWDVGIDGGVFSFGDAAFYGSLPGIGIHVSDIVSVASTPDGKGYWMVGSDGGVFTFGDAQFFGSVPGALGRAAPNPVTGFVPTSDGKGYWMVASDGGVFTFGDAAFFGSLPGSGLIPSQARVAQSETQFAYVGSTGLYFQPTADDRGYWIADSSGNVYVFGDARSYGTLPQLLGSASYSAAIRPNDIGVGHATTVPITGFVATPDGGGYWMAGTDGSVYTFGDAKYFGSLPGSGVNVPPISITGFARPSTVSVQIPLSTVGDMVRSPDGGGYWLASFDGGVFAYGDANFYGSVPGVHSSIRTIAP